MILCERNVKKAVFNIIVKFLYTIFIKNKKNVV